MANEPIRTNLFRFVTLRNPQLVEDEDKDPGFIFYPFEDESRFHREMKDLPDEEKEEAMLEAVKDFAAFQTRIDVREKFGKLYAFSTWLMQNKNALSLLAIRHNINDAEVLSPDNEFLVWENLLYQLISRTSPYVREACIQILAANKFLEAFFAFIDTIYGIEEFSPDQLREFTRRAHASVVVKNIYYPTIDRSAPVNATTSGAFERSINLLTAEYSRSLYQTLSKELSKVEKPYNNEVKANYDSALAKYNKEVGTIIEKAEPLIVEKKDESGNVQQVKTYPDLKIPKFSFKKADLNQKYIKGKLSKISSVVLAELNLDSDADFTDITTAVKEKIKQANQTIFKARLKAGRKKARIGGVTVILKENTPKPYGYSAVYKTLAAGETGFFIKLATDYANAAITKATFQVKTEPAGKAIKGLEVKNMDSTKNSLTAFFSTRPVLIEAGTRITLSGSFTLNNEKVFGFSSTGTADANAYLAFNGISILEDQEAKNEEISPNFFQTIPVYGVTSLGIADFRRVEQEVCCYVPGEVSHIENILAREYKERETRSLNSIESTTEIATEREVENLTDTTTTERNEMQSEVASVLNEDESRNSGANANVSGSFGKTNFSTGAYFDLASSSSVSNSNSQAVTYAKEITERALERIVQKISSKRTTRILKEFEETNTHGFDNTEGTEHVTGVYRWVDKIYKNKLINYGKRLMYEFAIPEPAKFLKHAIWVQGDGENPDDDSSIILPEAPQHPSVHGIHNAEDLNEENYQIIAGHYGAEVNAIPEAEITVGDSYFSYTSAEQGHGSVQAGGGNGTIAIPQGYYSSKAKAILNVVSDGHTSGGRIMSVTIGNYTESTDILFGSHTIDTSDKEVDKFFEEFPVSYNYSNHVSGDLTVSVKCLRSEALYKQWQNETFVAIMDAYEQKVREYNEAQQASELIPESDPEKLRFSPLFNRSLERREIKRIAIELISRQKGYYTAQNNYELADGTEYKVKISPELQKHASVVKFFEQAFDWEIMAYTFYPYFYADENDWIDLFQEVDAADPLFQAFLQSGFARAVVPVRPGFEDAVNWFMETGEIWNGQGLVVDHDDDLYVSVAEEMQTTEGEVEDTWETRLPTSLTLVQAQTAVLDEGGLPCYCEEHASDSSITPSAAIPVGKKETASADTKKAVKA